MFHYHASLPSSGGNCFKKVLANVGPFTIKLLKDFMYDPHTKPKGSAYHLTPFTIYCTHF